MKEKELIYRYLKGELTESERIQFSLRLAKDKAFRQQVEAERLLHEAILLDRRDHPVTLEKGKKKPNGRTFGWLIAGLLVGALAAWVFFFADPPENASTIPSPPSVENEQPEEKQLDNQPSPASDAPQPEEPKESTPPQPAEPPKEKKAETEKPRKLIYAANFTENPLLEEAISASGVRGNDLKMQLELPASNASVILENGAAPLRFRGGAKGGSNQPDVRWLLFSNRQAEYENWQPLAEQEIIWKEATDGLSFSFQKNLELPPGLYYYIFEDVENETYLLVGKLTVDD